MKHVAKCDKTVKCCFERLFFMIEKNREVLFLSYDREKQRGTFLLMIQKNREIHKNKIKKNGILDIS